MGIKKYYDRSFKERAVKLSHQRDNIKELAIELGISAERIYKWQVEFAEHGTAAFQGQDVERLSEDGKRVKDLEKKLKSTELELEILKKASAVFSKIDKYRQVMYAFIDCNRGRYSVGMMARVLRISSRSYYDYKRGIHSLREQRQEQLENDIRDTYSAAKGRYGAPRIDAELQKNNISVSVNTVSRYMKRMGLRSKLSRKWRNVSYPEYTLRICPNHLDCQFTVGGPGKVWVSDITYIHTTRGFKYLTSVIDLFDRKAIGWSFSGNLTAADTAVRAYRMAVRSRKPQLEMIFHSDRGAQYASEEFRNALDKNVVQSMSRKGNCWGNAVVESFSRASSAS